MPGKNGCDSYCEQTLEASYGREVPFHVGVCQNATTCLVANGESVTYTNTYSIDIGLTGTGKRDELMERDDDPASVLTAAFNIGASYSWSKSVGYTTTTTFSKTLDSKTCGYWTFIPYLTVYVAISIPAPVPNLYLPHIHLQPTDKSKPIARAVSSLKLKRRPPAPDTTALPPSRPATRRN